LALTDHRFKPVTERSMKGEPEQQLRERESDHTGAKQHNPRNGHGQEGLGSKFIMHGTPPFTCPVLEWKDRAGAQSKSFLFGEPFRAGLML
jgi:hypothetical protein